MIKNQTVYCLGDTNVDALLPIESYPEIGGDRRSDDLVLEIGGSVTNSALLLDHLGASSVLLASVGQDLFADYLREKLAETQLDLTYLHSTNQASTGMMFVPVTDDGQRTLFGQRGANRYFEPEHLPTSFEPGSALLLSGYALLETPQATAAARAFEIAKRDGLFIAMDSAYEPPLVAPDAFKPYFEQLDLLVLGAEEAKALARQSQLEAAVRWLQDQGISTIALKVGKDGSRLYQQTDQVRIPALAQEVIDTTGAGDNFSGGLLYGLLAGLSLASSGILATAAAAHIIGRWGAGRQAAWLRDLYEILSQAPVEALPGLESAKKQAINHLQQLLSAGD